MKSFLLPTIIMLVGTVLIAQPMVKGDCGLNPEEHKPGKCKPPYTVVPEATQSMCIKLSDGSCFSMNCSGELWDNAIPGRCDTAIVTENGVPVCLSSFAATAVTLNRYTTICSSSGGNCSCIRTPTGQTTTVTVCNCKDLPPITL